jgi:hypothetical protein
MKEGGPREDMALRPVALLRAGCDTTIRDEDGNTGKQSAADHGHMAVLERLQVLVPFSELGVRSGARPFSVM